MRTLFRLLAIMGLATSTGCLLISVAGVAAAEATVCPAAGALDPNLPFYRPVKNLQGELKLGGSNTLSHVATFWIDGFKRFYPDLNISVDVRGSRQAVHDVRDGQADIGLLSRTIFPEEVQSFRQTHGFDPTVLTPCLERTAIYVHKDNPIPGLTIPQVDALFSQECRRGGDKHCGTWRQFSLSEPWAGEPIVVHGRTKDTGSQVFLQQAVLLGSPLREDLQTHRTNIEMLQAIAEAPNSIGFCGLSYANPGVRAVPLAFAEGEEFVAIDSAAAARGRYPLVRQLQLVVQHNPQGELPALQQEFIKYVFSRLGQEDVVKAGFQAIPARPARLALDAVGLGVSR